MPDIYEQHKAAFSNVSAYCVMRGDDRVATIAFKFPRDGAGRLYAYVHWLGLEMVRGHAAGGGYDKRSAACANAAKKMLLTPMSVDEQEKYQFPIFAYDDFRRALIKDDGHSWDGNLRKAGFEVWQAV